MTAGIVTPISSGRAAKTVQSKANAESGSNFLDVFKASAGNSGNSEKLGENAFKVGENKETQSKKNKNISDETKKKVETKRPEVEEENVSDKADDISEATQNVASVMAQILEVPAESIQEALDELGLEAVDLLEASNIPEIAVEVTGAADVVDIMTDEELFADVKEIMQEVESISADLADELGVSVDELNDAAKEIINESQTVAESVNVSKTADDTDRDASTKEGSENGQMNFTQTFVENIKASVEKADVEAGYATDMNEIYNQVSESLKVNMSEDITEMEMNLHPASLGNVKIHVAERDGMITANFTTQNEQVKAALETQIVELKESMNEQGIKVENIEITLASHAFEENLSKEGEQTSSGGEEKKKRRSINLNELEEIDDINIEDDIRIAREMMMHNGTTVDYMA